MRNDKRFSSALPAACVSLFFCGLCLGDVPRQIHFQGRLRNSMGAPVNATVSVRFRIYDDPVASTTVLFDETHAGVSVSNGLFDALIGAQTVGGVPDTALDPPAIYLGVTIDSGPELSPRTRMVSLPYSLKTIDAERLVRPNTCIPEVIVDSDGHVGVGTTTPSGKLDTNGVIRSVSDEAVPTTGAGIEIQWADSTPMGIVQAYDRDTTAHQPLALWGDPIVFGPGIERVRIEDDGKVGIGTASPTAGLDLRGQIRIVDGTQGNTKVLTSDANGLASWQFVPDTSLWSDTGTLIFPKNADDISITDTGNLGVGTWAPSARIHAPGAPGDAIVGSGAGRGVVGINTGTGNEGRLGTAVEGVRGESSVSNVGRLGTGIEAVRGDHNTGSFGQLGVAGEGAHGEHSNGNYGRLGASNEGAYGRNNNSNFGWLGGPDEGARGEHSNGNFGQLGVSNAGAHGKHSSSQNYGRLGTADEGAYGHHDATHHFGQLGTAEEGVFGAGGSKVGVKGVSDGKIGVWGDGGYGDGVVGESIGDFSPSLQNQGRGVFGFGKGISNVNYGVHGKSQSNTAGAAGIRAEGNGAMGPGQPQAAALEIRRGAINIAGLPITQRPAGTYLMQNMNWLVIVTCVAAGHNHTMGYYADDVIMNDLVVPDSIVLLTIEFDEQVDFSWYVQVLRKMPGQIHFRVTRMGDLAGCAPPSAPPKIHYLIMNPVAGPP